MRNHVRRSTSPPSERAPWIRPHIPPVPGRSHFKQRRRDRAAGAAFSFSTSGRTSSLDRELLEVGQPPVGSDQRVVRAEQHLVLQLRVRVSDQVLGEVLRRPAGEVDVDVGLVHGDRERLVLPGEGGVGEDDVESRGSRRRRRRRTSGWSTSDGRRPPPGMPGADPGRAGMEQGDQPRLGDHLVERIVGAVVGPERLRVGVELEPADARPRSAPAPRARRACPCAGPRCANGISTSGFARAASSTSSLPTRRRPIPASSSTVKTTATHDRARGSSRRPPGRLAVMGCHRSTLPQPPAARRSPGPAILPVVAFGVRVYVDRDHPS